MRKKLLAILILSALVSGGCSKSEKADYGVRNGVLFNEKDSINCVSHSGYKAEGLLKATGDKIEITWHNSFDDCPNNSAGVMSTDTTKDGDYSYFVMYLGTEYVVHKEIDGHMLCAHLRMNQETAQDATVVLQSIENQMENLHLKDEYNICSIDDTVFVKDIECTAKTSGLETSGFIVKKGKVQTTKTTDINGTTVGYINQNGFDYYQFGDYCIKAVTGFDISPNVTFVSRSKY